MQNRFNLFLAFSLALHGLMAITFTGLPEGNASDGNGIVTVSLQLAGTQIIRASSAQINTEIAASAEKKTTSSTIPNKSTTQPKTTQPKTTKYENKKEGNVSHTTVNDNIGKDSNTAQQSLASKGHKDSYERKIRAWLEQHKDYPRKAKRQHLTGEALLSFTLDKSGNVASFQIARSTGHRILDKAVINTLKAANPMPKAPSNYPDNNLAFQIPITFTF